MGFGTEILFILTLGLLVLGPKQLHALLGHVARAKAKSEEARRGFKSAMKTEEEKPSVTAAIANDQSLTKG